MIRLWTTCVANILPCSYNRFAPIIQLPAIKKAFEHYVIFYPDSTIGNFAPKQAQHFLADIARFLVPSGGMLIDVDLKKDPAILETAYNDPQGITAAFNKNILHRLNRELGRDFKINQFRHKAFYNTQKGRIEIHRRAE